MALWHIKKFSPYKRLTPLPPPTSRVSTFTFFFVSVTLQQKNRFLVVPVPFFSLHHSLVCREFLNNFTHNDLTTLCVVRERTVRVQSGDARSFLGLYFANSRAHLVWPHHRVISTKGAPASTSRVRCTKKKKLLIFRSISETLIHSYL